MNEPIGLTLTDLFNILMALCGAIITVSAAVGIIVKFVDKAKGPNKLQDERITALEGEVKVLKELIATGSEKQALSDNRIDKVETEMREVTRVIIEGLQALTAHAIDGNNVEQLNKARDRLDRYLLDKV